MNASTDHGAWKRGAGYSGPADLEREGDQLRADMDRTLDEIERELSPRKLMDRSMEFFREHGSDFVREAGDTIRRNPLPVLLTAAGVAWLTAAIASSRSQSPRRQRWHAERWNGERWNGGGSHFDGDRLDAGTFDEDTLDEDRAAFEDFSAGHGYADTSVRPQQDWQERGWPEQDRPGQDRSGQDRSGQDRPEESHLARLVREQPVALGALALAAGALLGAALPMTEYENRMMGPVRDRSFSGSKRDRSERRSEPGNEESRGASSSAAGANADDAAMIDE